MLFSTRKGVDLTLELYKILHGVVTNGSLDKRIEELDGDVKNSI